jgi:hypothetical protein
MTVITERRCLGTYCKDSGRVLSPSLGPHAFYIRILFLPYTLTTASCKRMKRT